MATRTAALSRGIPCSASQPPRSAPHGPAARPCRTALLHGPAARPCILSPTAASTRPRSLAIYLAAVIRAVVALHHLIDNKLTNKEKESAADKEKEKEEKKEEKDKDEKPADEKPDDTKKGAK